MGKACVVEKTNPAQTLLLVQDSHVTRRLTLVVKSRAAIAIAALKLLTKKEEVDCNQACATLRKSHSNRKMYAATRHRVHKLPRWNCLHVEAVAPGTKAYAVRLTSHLILGEDAPLTPVKGCAEMTAAVLVSRHPAVRVMTVKDCPIQLLQAQFLLAVIPEAVIRVLGVRTNPLILNVSHAIQL